MLTGFIFRQKDFDVEDLTSLSIGWRLMCFDNVGGDYAPADTQVFSRNKGAEHGNFKPGPALACFFRDSAAATSLTKTISSFVV
jgi:hypothetical protein